MNICQAGHKHHIRKQTSTFQGPFWVWDWDTYKDFAGYCTGQDDVSRTLLLYGVWEAPKMECIRKTLHPGDLFLDFGAHVGWFTILAALAGATVCAYEGDLENLELLQENARLYGVLDQLTAYGVWVDAKANLEIPQQRIRLIKIDLEGNEIYAVAALRQHIEAGLIDELIIEISPCFNDSYFDLVTRLQKRYDVYEESGVPWDGCWDFSQKDLWFRRRSC